MRSYIESTDLSQELNALVGELCWGIVAGPGTGSHISLTFGEKRPRQRVLTNPHLSEDQQRCEGEFILYVTCAWRLQGPGRVICSSASSNVEGGPLQKGLKRLVGDVVNEVSVRPPAFDVEVRFSSGLVLLVFCDISDDEEEEDNYSLFTPTDILTVSGGSQHVTHEGRSPSATSKARP